jgi:arabinan endo-1,5-alpha-L-arabinosidase
MKRGFFLKWTMLLLAISLILPNSSIVFAEVSISAEADDSLVAHYSFDGDLVDDTGNGVGTETGDRIENTGGKITYVDGIVGQAAKFDGGSGVLLQKGLISRNTYSVSLWLNPEELVDFTTIFFGAASPDHWISLVPKLGNQTTLWSSPGFYEAGTGMMIEPNEWTHVAFTVAEGTVDVYINGENKHSSTNFPDVAFTEDSIIGLGVNYWDTPYKGLMDELSIYDGTALSAEEIKATYEQEAFAEIGAEALKKLIEKAKAITNKGKYTEDSFAVLTAAIKAAEGITEETEIRYIASELQAAMNGLIEIGPKFKNVSVHDPSIIKNDDGTYYVFGSHIEAAKSTDLMNWDRFTNGYHTPGNIIYGDLSENLAGSFEWAGENDSDSKDGFAVWAPEAIWNEDYLNKDGSKGAYMMYYSASSTYIRSAIGYAVSQDLEGPYEYVDTIVYSGFTKEEAYDNDSDINKQWENTNIKTLVDDGKLAGARDGWFNGNNYNNQLFPNAIDANLFYDEQGKLWMTYGSWSGGIFILEIDPETGAAIYPGKDGTTADGRLIDRYFGTKISGGYGKSGEGPYVAYDKKSGYYFLNVTYGWLGADGGYQMRQFRAENPTGPYVDAKGQDAVLPGVNANHAHYGNKLIGNFLFDNNDDDPGTGIGYGYLSAGHNSVYIDPDTNEQYLVFHTRFPQRGEQHELRIHQMFMNEDNWPVVAPYRYSGEELSEMNRENLIGEYQFINHGLSISGETKDIIKATTIALNDDGTISGSASGEWTLGSDYYATLKIDGHTYKGVFINQWNSITESKGITFTALSDQGESIWGIKTIEHTDEELLEIIKNELTLGDTTGVVNDLTLPTEGMRGTKISWTTSNASVISNEGVIKRPAIGKDNGTATLTATISKDNLTVTKTFTIVVLAQQLSGLVAYYSFDEHLDDVTNEVGSGTFTGDRIDKAGGEITYENGILGKAAAFDGSSGIRLPNGLISSHSYSVSMWLHPEEFNNYTSAFFGATTDDNWISFTPRGHDDINNDTMLWSGESWYIAGTEMKIAANEWTHIAFTVHEGKIDLYVNGVNRHSSAGFPNVFATADASFGLGVNYWDAPYKGLMDELLIYDNFVLTEQEIKKYYDHGEIPGLEKQKMDVTPLKALIAQAGGIENSNYTDISYQALQNAIQAAERILETIDSEKDLNDAIVTLQKAIDGLKEQVTEKDIVSIKPIIKQGQAIISTADIELLAENAQLIIDLTHEKNIEEIFLTADQVNKLMNKNARIVINKSKINLTIPASVFNYNEDVTIKIEELPSNNIDLTGRKPISSIFDLTIMQNEMIHDFGKETVTIKFLIDEDKVQHTSNLRTYYFDENVHEWIEVEGRYEGGFMIVETNHFSEFVVLELVSEEGVSDPDPTSDMNLGIDRDLKDTTGDLSTTPLVSSQVSLDQSKDESNDTNAEIIGDEGKALPKTATSIYTILLTGFILLIIGLITLYIMRNSRIKE